MAESKNGDLSSVRKKKDALEDMDIGKDFFTSWSADGDALDFDITPASKDKNKKPYDFNKADMDFNFDDDFGKMSSFNMDFDISPPQKKDGKSKEKSKESSSGKDTRSSFDMDMPDLDISPPLKRGDKSKEKTKDSSSGKHTGSSFNMNMSDLDISPPQKRGDKSKEKSKDSSSRKNTGKTDCFAFAFDFDDLGDLGFGSSLTKEDSKAPKDKITKESSPDRGDCQDKDVSMHANVNTSMRTLKDGSQKPHLPEARISFDMDSLVGGSVDNERTRKTSYSNSAMEDAVTTEHSAAIDEVESDITEVLPENTNVSRELPGNGQSIELVSHCPVDHEACPKNDAMKELSSDYPYNNVPSGGNSSEAQNKVDSMHTNASGSNGEQDANVISVVGPTCSTLSKISERLQTVAISENINAENSWDLVEDHVTDDRGKTALAQINSPVENPSTATAELGVLHDSQDANVISVVGSTCSTLSKNSEHLQAVAISECINTENSRDLVEDHVTNDREKTVLGQINSVVENPSTATAVLGVLHDSEDANVISVVGSTCSTFSKNSEHLQTVAISQNINTANSWDLVEDHVTDDRGKTVLGQINSLVENPSTATAVSGVLHDSQSGREILESSRIQKLSLGSQPAFLKEKQIEKERESLVNSSLPSILQEKPECPLLKVSTQATFSSLSSKKMGFAQPNLVKGRRDGNTSQDDNKLVSLSLQHSKALLRGELPQIRSQENCNDVKTCGEMGNAGGIQKGKNTNVSFETQIKDMVIPKPATRKRETSMKDLNTLSMDINKKAAKNSEKPTTLTSISTKKNIPLEEHRLSATGLPKLKLTGVSLDSIKSPIQKDSKSVGNSSQKSPLLRKAPSAIAHFPNTQKQTPSTLSMKRTLEDAAAKSIALYPSKRVCLSSNTSRNLVETSEKVLNKKVPSHNPTEDDRIINTVDNFQVMAIHLPHEVKNRGVEISFSIQNDSNIKTADVYNKKLDDICNILKKKNYEAKELLARAIVNNNKLLLLNNFRIEEKVRAAQDMLARLTLNKVHD